MLLMSVGVSVSPADKHLAFYGYAPRPSHDFRIGLPFGLRVRPPRADEGEY
jgi:hypothetical protein